ncbi:hypothetical protein FRC08_003360 [Ceratobasidium sp. 394]|nr:hypothetical protein FRC08_003360 [Ceratobasidium sp. 394]
MLAPKIGCPHSFLLAVTCLANILPESVAASQISLSRLVFEATPTKGPWTSYSLSPESHIHTPVSVLFANGTVSNPQSLVASEPYRSLLPPTALHGSSSSITLDFGKNVAGIPTITFSEGSDPGEVFGMAFAESKQFVSRTSDRSVII